MEKIDISKLEGNQPTKDEECMDIPYSDIRLLAEKINELIEERDKEYKIKKCEYCDKGLAHTHKLS